jgi:hypothetical protein
MYLVPPRLQSASPCDSSEVNFKYSSSVFTSCILIVHVMYSKPISIIACLALVCKKHI